MKHNFLDLINGTKKRPAWFLPAILAAGILLGAVATAAVMIWAVPQINEPESKAQTASENQDAIEGEEATSTEEGGLPVATLDTQGRFVNVKWDANVVPLTLEESEQIFVDSGLEKEAVHTAITATDTCSNFVGMWKAGKVEEEGLLKDTVVYLIRTSECGLGQSFGTTHLFRRSTGEILMTERGQWVVDMQKVDTKYRDAFPELLRTATLLPNVSILGLQKPSMLKLTTGQTLRERFGGFGGNDTYRFDFKEPFKEVGRTAEGQPVYLINDCAIVFAPDGRAWHYAPSLLGYDGGATPAVRWEPGFVNTEKYLDQEAGGCGIFGCSYVVENAVVQEVGTKMIGKTTNDEPIYAPANPKNHSLVKKAYDEWFVPDGNTKPSIDEFLRRYPAPVFFWKDPFDRWIVNRIEAAIPPGECGKPVIYLYPEQTTDVAVRLPSFINVTVSDPTYPTNGWNVTAQPNGQLTSHEDGNTYGSLYWEGTGVGYALPKEGFIVKDGEVESFLADVLPKYGLNETEAREFMEFWVPEMTGAPYYRVSFLTSAWSEAAPLFVSPRPQTSIRIFMDWKPISAPVSIPEPKIVTPARNGFTLVEWGGTLWK